MTATRNIFPQFRKLRKIVLVARVPQENLEVSIVPQMKFFILPLFRSKNIILPQFRSKKNNSHNSTAKVNIAKKNCGIMDTSLFFQSAEPWTLIAEL
jgi:hypothetical protein